jgi:preprotein translocase subunit SecE
MVDVDEKKRSEALEVAGSEERPGDLVVSPSDAVVEGPGVEGHVMESLGADKYVIAAFFAAGIGVAFLVGKTLASVWNMLAAQPWAARKLPLLLRYAEEERLTYTMIAGAVVGLISSIVLLRSERVRHWADDVALELSKVTWPKKETVTNGTIVVIAAGLFATVYIGLLDRLWGFVTMLVYGA